MTTWEAIQFLWRHRPGNEIPAKVLDVWDASFRPGYRPLILKQARTSRGWWFMVHIPPGVTLRKLEEYKEAIMDYIKCSAEIRVDGERVTLELFTEQLGTEYPFEFEWEKYGKMELPIHMGLTNQLKPAVYDLMTAPHVLIGGNTGLGKSNLLHTIVASLLLSRNVELAIIDPKIVEFAYLEPYVEVVTEEQDIKRYLERQLKEMRRRLKLLKDGNAVKIQNYQGNMKPRVTIIDELADITDKTCQDMLFELLRKGRAPGMPVVAAIQRPSSTVFRGQNFGDSKFLFRVRVCFSADSTNSKMVLDNNHATFLPEIEGRCIVQWGTETEVQNLYLPPDKPDIITPLLEKYPRRSTDGTDEYTNRLPA